MIIMQEVPVSEDAVPESKRGGRPRLSDDVRRSLISLRLPAWLAEWLKNQPASSGVLIEEALCTVHGLKRPHADLSGVTGPAPDLRTEDVHD